MDGRFRYGVIGTGMMGVEHIMNITHIDNAEVVAIADPNEAPLTSAASIAPAAVALTSPSELLSSGLCRCRGDRLTHLHTSWWRNR